MRNHSHENGFDLHENETQDNSEIAECGNMSFSLCFFFFSGSKFIFRFGSTCVTRCKFLGVLAKF